MKLELLFLATSLSACGGAAEERPELSLYAAASLRDVLSALEPGMERASGARLVLNLGSSGDLARQIVAAGEADLFLSADEEELARVEAAGWVEPGTSRVLVSNQLVVVEPVDERGSLFSEPFTPRQLAGGELELLSLANPATVPAGKYARRWLEAAGCWESLAEKVLPGVDVRAALAAVESGAARAGIVYRTDAARSKRVRVVYAVPLEVGPRVVYPLAVLNGRPERERALRLAAFLASEEAAAVFARHGFVPLARSQ